MRNYNFSAGPSMLPLEVLKKAQEQMLDYEGTGMSVMEMSHRAKCYDAIIKKAEADLRTLMNIPENYKVLFIQGGASQQFAAVPLNLSVRGKADYIITGNFASLSFKEASRFTNARAAASSQDKNYTYIPRTTAADFDRDADYVHITTNNTIFGTHYTELPDTAGVPLVADMSSCGGNAGGALRRYICGRTEEYILRRAYDSYRAGGYAGAQHGYMPHDA